MPHTWTRRTCILTLTVAVGTGWTSLASALTATPNPTFAACTGNCDAGADVTVDELIRGVNIALGALGLDVCGRFDANGDGRVTINELIAAVSNALFGCGVTPPTPVPTRTPTRTSLPTDTPTHSPVPTAIPSTPTRTPTRSPNDVSGHYEGSWRSNDGDGGSLSIDLLQSGNQVTGSAQVFGSDCFGSGEVTGTMNGNRFTGTFTDGFTRLQLQLTVNGDRLNGTYRIQSGCYAGDSGNINLTRF